jgi:hypothetical protein
MSLDKTLLPFDNSEYHENNFFILKYLGIKTWSVKIPFNFQNNISNLERESYNCNIELKDGTFVLTRK